jgi:hypothetical protein
MKSLPSASRAIRSGLPSPLKSNGASRAVKTCQPLPICLAGQQVRLAVAAPVAGREQRGEAAPAGADRQAAARDERAGARAAVQQQLAGRVDRQHVGLLVAAPVRPRGHRAEAHTERRDDRDG